MKKFKKLDQISLLLFMLASFFMMGQLVIRIKKLEKNIAILKEGMFGLCDAGDETFKLITDTQNKVVEVSNEIQKLKQTQK